MAPPNQYKYICFYDWRSSLTPAQCQGDSIYDFKDGFWIDGEGKFTKGSDCKYWIPPARIYYIERREVEEVPT